MRFPYLPVDKKEFAPIIPLKMFGKDGWIGFEAYVDSGASFSIFHIDRAEILGIKYEKGERIHMTVGDGGLIEVFIHRLKVRLAGEGFFADIGFSKQLGIGFNLLGRKSFFDRFRICFDDSYHFLELHPRE